MFFLLAENNVPPLSYQWWIANALVPAVGAFFGVVCSFVIAILAARRSEWYRRLSRWEPYSIDLWKRQHELYAEVCVAAIRLYRITCNRAHNWDQAASEERQQLQDAYETEAVKMGQLATKASLLLSTRFNELLESFQHQTRMLASGAKPSERFPHSDKALKLYGELLRAARESMNIDALGESARMAIENGLKEETQGHGKSDITP